MCLVTQYALTKTVVASPSFQTLEYLKTCFENFKFKMKECLVIAINEDINMHMLIDETVPYTKIVFDACAAFVKNI